MRTDSAQVAELLQAGADPNVADEDGRLPLHAAVFAGSAEVVRYILEARADANLAETEREGVLPLELAACQGHVEALKLLVESGAAVDAADKRGATPLCSAAANGRRAAVQALLDAGADPSRPAVVERQGKVTPMQAAARGGHLEIAQALKDASANAPPYKSPTVSVFKRATRPFAGTSGSSDNEAGGRRRQGGWRASLQWALAACGVKLCMLCGSEERASGKGASTTTA